MDEDIFFWIKLTSFLLAMIVSFQVGRYYERFRLLRFLKKQGDRIEKVLDDFFSPPLGPDLQARPWQPWEAERGSDVKNKGTEKKHFLS
jgi:hypothetical protein